ncbi:MAG: right-handed parallel beta-helix repeat-containing protein [Rouxiella aceris]|uniref:right-handed parallel beta-helix repeat-containing protein n=1 Tax=Rouxiella aceris TaxID=2703884 RepID=UPI00283C1290|nr:right-handed parallel beta-helix repeat-containing protein [Rouxiella aceris]MDR3434537.1 right-handed parallel beta-helix repeat-containing protein [Rouxiella aceris]
MNRRNFIFLVIAGLVVNQRVSLSDENKPTENITDRILSGLSQGNAVNIPDGVYEIDAGKIVLNSGSSLIFGNATVLKINNSTSNEQSLFTLDGKEGVSITGGHFISTDDSVVLFKIQNGSKNINVANISCEGCRLLFSDVLSPYDRINNSLLNENISITHCRGKANKLLTRRAFVEFHYTQNSQCVNCDVEGYYHGLMFWGGDSNPNRDGDENNQRKTSHLTFKNNNLRNLRQGGIWGSMGEYITIDTNSLENGGDVGIDFEGCNSCVATNNTVKNFRHGGLATFFICNDILFKNNTSISTDEKNKIAAIFNATQKQSNKKIYFLNNKFLGEGVVAAFGQNGAVTDLLIKENTFTNITVDLTSNNNGKIQFVDNKFAFSLLPSKAVEVVRVANVANADNEIVLTGNQVKSDHKWFADKSVFYIDTLSARNFQASPEVSNNAVDQVQFAKANMFISKIKK